jgi:hypothetical protein
VSACWGGGVSRLVVVTWLGRGLGSRCPSSCSGGAVGQVTLSTQLHRSGMLLCHPWRLQPYVTQGACEGNAAKPFADSLCNCAAGQGSGIMFQTCAVRSCMQPVSWSRLCTEAVKGQTVLCCVDS